MTNLERILRDLRETLVDRALDQLHEAHLFHYEREKDKTNERLAQLFDLTLQCVAEQCADPIVVHANKIAKERFAAGYDLSEVQTSINIMEEVLCARVVELVHADEVAGALGIINAIFSMTKDMLAQAYVALAAGKE